MTKNTIYELNFDKKCGKLSKNAKIANETTQTTCLREAELIILDHRRETTTIYCPCKNLHKNARFENNIKN
jgi:hypothetical protein